MIGSLQNMDIEGPSGMADYNHHSYFNIRSEYSYLYKDIVLPENMFAIVRIFSLGVWAALAASFATTAVLLDVARIVYATHSREKISKVGRGGLLLAIAGSLTEGCLQLAGQFDF